MAKKDISKKLSAKEIDKLLKTLKARFEKNVHRHKGVEWGKVESKLKSKPEKMWSLHAMEETGGEPDVVVFDGKSSDYFFVDCSQESPKGRRSLCYDAEALESRKENKPADSAMEMATAMGVEVLTEQQYRDLQKVENFDAKTSNWVKTPDDVRKLGGAIFCDYRFGRVFVYHNGAESYYAARGFRGILKV